MAPTDNDNPRRRRDDLDDNPFVAFRRFADSQVSSLFDTVFSIPATLASYNNAQHAREQCLFGKADPAKCEQLQELEDELATTESERRRLHHKGDIPMVWRKTHRLLELDEQADELRGSIVEDARRRDSDNREASGQTELIERVGKKQGQHWGWSWSWGFPESFDEQERARLSEGSTGLENKQRDREGCGAGSRKGTDDDWHQFSARWDDIKKKINEELPRVKEWSFPPPADASKAARPQSERSPAILDELGSMIMDEVARLMLPRSFSFDNRGYSPCELQENEGLKQTGIPWRDAYEDLMRVENGAPLIPPEQLGRSESLSHDRWVRRFWDPKSFTSPCPAGGKERQLRESVKYPKSVPWEGEETSEEPSYEYGHDHEDQHDDPPTPRVGQTKFSTGAPTTELEAYERLLGSSAHTSVSSNPAPTSILSTLTTTERTVGPDGTTTTKVVLKKRFADGREESSETVHTQRGQDTDARQDHWRSITESPSPGKKQEASSKPSEKKTGWFWSS